MLSTVPDSEFERALMGTVSLWRMEPAVLNGCSMPMPGTASMSFTVKR